MKHILILILTFILMINNVLSQEVYFQHLQVEDGLSQSSVNAIYQDEIGMIWMATRDGLNRYDGNRVEVFSPIPGDTTGLFSNNIQDICGDSNGHIYIRCKYGIVAFDLRKREFKAIRHSNIFAISYGQQALWVCSDKSIYLYNKDLSDLEAYYIFDIPGIRIVDIRESRNGLLYIGTLQHGLFVLDKNRKPEMLIPNVSVTKLYEDSKENMWACTREHGVYKLQRNGEREHLEFLSNNNNSLSSNFVRAICEDSFGNYWIGTIAGLNMFNPTTKRFAHYYHLDNVPHSLSSTSIRTIIKDNQGTLWIGSYFGGVDIFNPEYEIFRYYYPDAETKGRLNSAIVGCMVEDKSGNLWICTEGGGLNFYNRKQQKFRAFTKNNGIESNNLKHLWLDEKRQVLWIGTLLGGLNKLNINTLQFTTYKHDQKNSHSLLNNSVRKIVPLSDNQLLLATHDGVGLFNTQTNRCSRLVEDQEFANSSIGKQIMDIVVSTDSAIWFSSSLGLFRFNQADKTLKNYFPASHHTALGSSFVSKIFQDSKGRIWFGSSGNGLFLYQPASDSMVCYTANYTGIGTDYIVDINESQTGYLLIATTQGLSRYDVENNKAFNYNRDNGFPLTLINENGLFVSRDNEIFLGGTRGMISFYERNLHTQLKEYKINLTSLEVNNKRVLPSQPKSLLKNDMPFVKNIILPYNCAVITFEFAGTNYINALKRDVEYKLDGFDKEWRQANFRNYITYTNLNPGKYTLLLRGQKVYDKEKIVEQRLDIIIKPPFYKSIAAYFAYALLILAAVYGLMTFYATRLKLKASLEFEKKEKEQIKQLNHFKLVFFTNISHEFRTPLTLIMSQIEQLLEMGNLMPKVYGRLLNIQRNVMRMQRLISELLDFRKQDQGYMQPKVSKQDLIAFLNEIYHSFKEYAQFRNIKFTLTSKEPELQLWFDMQQLEKVVYNLLSNAFKHTPEQGSIAINVEVHDYVAYIKVSDTGAGIDEKELNKIFDRFYQVDADKEHLQNSGTGIGLALAKGIVEAHHGKIRVESKLHQGATFIVELPMDEHVFTTEQKTTTPSRDASCIADAFIPDEEYISEMKEAQKEMASRHYTMLIVEDNMELQQLLRRIFEPIYKVVTANDGVEGFEKTKEHMPDIVLSDVMMPRMSGIEMCGKIKTNIETSHIPVVLLTAQTAAEYTVTGFQTGADDYIIKPFNTKVLIARCNNLVNGRRLLQSKFAKQVDASPQMITHNTLDQELLSKAIEVVEKHIDDSEFDVNVFAQEMGLGRTNLFSKLKGITGQTPNDFIVNMRLKKAMMYIQTRPELSISEIAYEFGFNTPSYFIKCFKELFGVTPMQYRNNRQEKK